MRRAAAAKKVFAYDEALEMLAHARECAQALARTDEITSSDLTKIDESMGDAALAQGNVSAAVEHYERALSSALDPIRQNAVRAKAGEAYVISGDPRGLEHAERALAELDAGQHPREVATARMIVARYRHLEGKLEEAVDAYPAAIELAEQDRRRRPAEPDLLVPRRLTPAPGSLRRVGCSLRALRRDRRAVRRSGGETAGIRVPVGERLLPGLVETRDRLR